ncbi:hypothetical protein Tco_1488383, partial [Tanacetum coccineum]
MKERVERKMKLVVDNGDELVVGLQKWVDEADAYISRTQEFLQEAADAKKTFFNLRMCLILVCEIRCHVEACLQSLSTSPKLDWCGNFSLSMV